MTTSKKNPKTETAKTSHSSSYYDRATLRSGVGSQVPPSVVCDYRSYAPSASPRSPSDLWRTMPDLATRRDCQHELDSSPCIKP